MKLYRKNINLTLTAILMTSSTLIACEPRPEDVEIAASQVSADGAQVTSKPASAVTAADRPSEPEVSELLVLEPLKQSSVSITNARVQAENLVDGRIVIGGNFDAVGTGDGCTSALIGPKVLVTAAHCVDGKGSPAVVRDISLSPRINPPVTLNYSCTMHSKYQNAPSRGKAPRSSHDIALCLVNNPNDVPIGMKFEMVDLNQTPTVGKDILMTGYGCTGVGVHKFYSEAMQKDRYMGYVKGSSDGYMRVGNAKITETKDHPYFQSLPRTQAIVESHATVGGNGAKLCPGDSGGPVFVGITETNHQGARRIIGVNSSVGGIVSDALPVTIISNLVDFNDVTIQSFFNDFISDNKVKICGYGDQTGLENLCRQ